MLEALTRLGGKDWTTRARARCGPSTLPVQTPLAKPWSAHEIPAYNPGCRLASGRIRVVCVERNSDSGHKRLY